MRSMATELKAGRFDRIILFSGRISRGWIAWLSDIPVRIGFGYKPLQRIFLNRGPYIRCHPGPSVAVYREASALMLAHGFCQTPVPPHLEPCATQLSQMQARLAHLPRPLYAMAIGTSEAHKQWGARNYAELTRRLTESGAGVVLLGGPAEAQIASDIVAHLPASSQHGLTIVTDAPVLGSAATMCLADACVGNDTGMIHVAAAVGTPSFVLLGPRQPLDHDPAHMHNVRARKLSDITVDEVHRLLINTPSKKRAPYGALSAGP